jgi:predicted transcriptional regulator
MTKTTLEEFATILIALAQQTPLKPAQIETTTQIHTVKLKNHLNFLNQLGAIKEQTSKKSIAYEITPYGANVLSFFGLDKSILRLNQNNGPR